MYDPFWLALGEHIIRAETDDISGWTDTASKAITIVATIESLQGTVDRLCVEGYIAANRCKSLQSKLAAAKADRDRTRFNAAINTLEALLNEIKAQTGKSIDPKAAALLTGDVSYVIDRLGAE
jgi:hypothetical protein